MKYWAGLHNTADQETLRAGADAMLNLTTGGGSSSNVHNSLMLDAPRQGEDDQNDDQNWGASEEVVKFEAFEMFLDDPFAGGSECWSWANLMGCWLAPSMLLSIFSSWAGVDIRCWLASYFAVSNRYSSTSNVGTICISLSPDNEIWSRGITWKKKSRLTIRQE